VSNKDLTSSSVKPVHYDLDLHNLDTKAFTYDGLVNISLELKTATSSITLNSKELKIGEGVVRVEGSTGKS
jgi:hypothetical protein